MNYVNQKYSIELDPRFTIPKLKYKGTTVQYQRIKVKKSPKIQEVTQQHISQEERERMEQKGLDEQRAREALQEKEPAWSIYCYMGDDDLSRQQIWSDMIQRQFDAAAGDETDRWTMMQEQFKIEQ